MDCQILIYAFFCIAVEVTGLEQPLTVGETASVVCASILRVSSIQWLFDDEIVKEDTSGLQELDLTFSPVNDSIHNRQYICKVTADGTTYSYPITVMVEGAMLNLVDIHFSSMQWVEV